MIMDNMLLKNQKETKDSVLAPKTYILNRKNPVLIDLFKPKKQQGKQKVDRGKEAHRVKLYKGGLRAYLSKRYKGAVAEKILTALQMTVPLELDEYADMIEKILNGAPERLLRMGFNVFDFNEDKFLDELDMYAIMRTYDDDEEVFVNAFSYDLCTVAEYLKDKQRKAGIEDSYIHEKVSSIKRQMEKKGKN